MTAIGIGISPVFGSAAGAGGAATSVTIPYSIDFTALADGPLPSVWNGDTWSISSGVAINTPVGEEVLLNGSFTDWAAGVPNNWTKTFFFGDMALEENPAGQAHMSGTTHAAQLRQAFTPSCNFFKGSIDINALTGQLDLFIATTGWTIMPRITSTGTKASTAPIIYESAAATFLAILTAALPLDTTFDNASLKAMTDVFSLVESSENDVTVRTFGSAPSAPYWFGVIARADSLTNPRNYIMAIQNSTGVNGCRIYKCVNGTLTALKVTASSGASIEIRANGTDISVYTGIIEQYVGTVDEPTINDNVIHGLISFGGNSLQSFFCLSSVAYKSVFMGGSNTTGSASTWFWPNILNNQYIKEIVTSNIENAGYGGAGSWYGLFRYLDDVVSEAPDVLFIEFAVNDQVNFISGTRDNLWQPSSEALIRKLRAALPNTRIIFANLVISDSCYPVDSDYIASKNVWIALCEKYDIEYRRIDQRLEAILGTSTPTLLQAAPYADSVHFTADGHQEIANMFAGDVAGWYPHTGAGWTGNITDYDPPYFDDLADFMHDPIARNGTDNDGETGTGWSTTGTARQSSTPDDTISWTGTFSSCGLDHNWTGVIAWSVDGGAETQVNLAAGMPGAIMFTNFARDVHTVTIRVVSGTVRVNRFLAI